MTMRNQGNSTTRFNTELRCPVRQVRRQALHISWTGNEHWLPRPYGLTFWSSYHRNSYPFLWWTAFSLRMHIKCLHTQLGAGGIQKGHKCHVMRNDAMQTRRDRLE